MTEKRFNILVKRMRKKEDAAFNEIYNFYYPKIIKHLYFKYNNYTLSEDTAHDFFEKLLTMEIPQQVETPTAWVFKICENKAKNFFAGQGSIKTVPLEHALHIEAENQAFENKLYGDYTEKLKLLDHETQKIIIMRVFEDCPLKEIAEDLHMNYSCVRQKYSRGLKKLKNM